MPRCPADNVIRSYNVQISAHVLVAVHVNGGHGKVDGSLVCHIPSHSTEQFLAGVLVCSQVT